VAERGALNYVLCTERAGAEELRQQARHAVVTGRCGCGCPSIDLLADRNISPRSPLVGVRPAIDVRCRAPSGELFDLLLWADDGWLEGLELVWYGMVSPPVFPAVGPFDG